MHEYRGKRNGLWKNPHKMPVKVLVGCKFRALLCARSRCKLHPVFKEE
jgi:hypothetical protein